MTTAQRLDLAIRHVLDRIDVSDRGEGVISAAIVVLIFALLGAGMWVAFDGTFTGATERATNEIGNIGG